jgi:hypothetical protein
MALLKSIPRIFIPKLFYRLSAAFVFFTVIGTLSHEAGHYTAARLLGYDARIGYGYTRCYDKSTQPYVTYIIKKYRQKLRSGENFPGKERFLEINAGKDKVSKWITLAGPLQTILTGTFGLVLILVFFRVFKRKETLSFRQWIMIFIAMFWLRQTANLFVGIAQFVLTGNKGRADERWLDCYYELPSWTLEIMTGSIGLATLAFILFKVIPQKIRFTFIASGLAGGIFGYLFWLRLAGPIIIK